MKGLVVLAMLLMVPSMAYYQKQTHAGKLQGRLQEQVRQVLLMEGVEQPEARVVWLDARISGTVETLDRRRAVGDRIDQLLGLRLLRRDNHLRVRGWILLSRDEGLWKAEGLMPEGFEMAMMAGVEQETPWDGNLERNELVEAPPQLADWERFAGEYFAEPGNRGLRLQGGTLILQGEATSGSRADWLAAASRVVGKERVQDRLEVLPSLYHYRGYVPESSRSAAEVKRLREELGGLAVEFAEEAVEVEEGERKKVADVAGVMLQSGERIRYVVAAVLPDDREETIKSGRRRVEVVMELLEGYGVGEAQLVPEVFVATAAGPAAGRVEFLLK